MRRSLTPLLLALALAALAGTGPARAQCILANPSFELPGSSGAVFGGWNQFGSVGSAATTRVHGHVAARATGPNTGNWDVSGFWQSLDASPGERFQASVSGWHTAVNPLTGGSQALLNIEWRDASGNLISYESHIVATASTPLDEVQAISVQTQAAPTGTAAARILVGALQQPGQPAPDVYFDQVAFNSLGPPTLDDIQWNDFPGGRTLDFSDRTWRVKGPGYYGPGPSLFCDTSSCAWVDANGRLHLTIKKIGGSWYSTEVTLTGALGYGDYVFTTLGRLDTLDPHAVFGLFLWEYGPCYDPGYLWWNPYNEIDVEFSRWGNPANAIAQFVAQPADYPGNIDRFDAAFSDSELTSHAFRWLPDRVEYRSWRGGPGDESPAALIHTWTYTGPHLPRPGQPRIHLNLWQVNGPPATDQEVVLDAFTFVPEAQPTAVPSGPGPPGPGSYLRAATPNPFRSGTVVAYTVDREGPAEVAVYDVAGRLVRTLVDGPVAAGGHTVSWDGRDEAGNPVASGLYLYRLRTGNVVESRRVVRLR